MKIVSCQILLLLYISIIHSTIGQNVVQTEKKDSNLFDSFINLFSNIEDTSDALQEQEIEMSHYPNFREIDSIYTSFIHRIPFFSYYATFKVKKTNGFVACVYGRYTDAYSMLSYLDIIVYSLDGAIKESVRLPYTDDALLFGYYSCVIFASTKSIIYNYNYYNDNSNQCQKKIIFDIDDDGHLVEM